MEHVCGEEEGRDHFPLNQGITAVSTRGGWDLGIESQIPCLPQAEHKLSLPKNRKLFHRVHNSCDIKAMITAASQLSLSAYLWHITHL